ncbi:hypothetical protein GB927_025745 [Shinella sp. CPCC 100929]|uniref:Uncharacterized protein n=1 Tax=Shinella lacus TaxID=2654216 RepID=A0ABT1REF0_9HYPH|nr:hypothetical protein [Shinella lacus]MCQ4633469.1 hypothetical protein [Shinella lacus]
MTVENAQDQVKPLRHIGLSAADAVDATRSSADITGYFKMLIPFCPNAVFGMKHLGAVIKYSLQNAQLHHHGGEAVRTIYVNRRWI